MYATKPLLRANWQYVVMSKMHIYFDPAMLLQDTFSREAVIYVLRKYKGSLYSICFLISKKWKYILFEGWNGEVVVCISIEIL